MIIARQKKPRSHGLVKIRPIIAISDHLRAVTVDFYSLFSLQTPISAHCRDIPKFYPESATFLGISRQ